jgi:hypothetical protein
MRERPIVGRRRTGVKEKRIATPVVPQDRPVETHKGRPPWALALVAGVVVLAIVVVVFAGSDGGDPPPTTVAFASTTTTRPRTTTTVATETTTPPAMPVAAEVVPGWTQLDGGPLEFRTDPGSAWTGREIIVVGGVGHAGVTVTDGAAYDVRSRRWRRIATPPMATDSSVAVWTGREVLVFTTTVTAAYDPIEDTWRPTAASPEVARPVGAVWTGDEVIIVANARGPTRSFDRLLATAYDPRADTWRRLADPLAGMSYASALWDGSRLSLVGGFLDPNRWPRSDNGLATAQAYDPETDSWLVLDGLDLQPNAVVAEITDRGILAWEYSLEARTLGADGAWHQASSVPLDFSECYPETVRAEAYVLAWYCGRAALYEPDTGAWVEIMVPPDLASGRFELGGLTAAGTEVFLWGRLWDRTRAGLSDPALWRFDAERAATARISPADVAEGWSFAPIPELRWRDTPSMVWTGAEIILWGGHGVREEIYDGFAYDPVTGVSHRIPKADYPGRHGQVAVWTGEEMFTWPANAAWNPRTVEWRSISLPSSLPDFPGGGPIAWTGREVLLMGNASDNDSGGVAYDPAADTWRALAPSPNPPGSEPAQAWSGRELYLWGRGVPDRGFWYQDGAAYNPFAGTWRLLPPLPEVGRMSGPVGAWSGDEFLIVGVGDQQSLNDMPHLIGAAYQEATDTWRIIGQLPLSTHDNEGLAGSLLAVWTGQELAVWLPAPYFGETPQLGFYNPSTDRWQVSPHLPFDTEGWGMTFTGNEIAVLSNMGLLLFFSP